MYFQSMNARFNPLWMANACFDNALQRCTRSAHRQMMDERTVQIYVPTWDEKLASLEDPEIGGMINDGKFCYIYKLTVKVKFLSNTP